MWGAREDPPRMMKPEIIWRTLGSQPLTTIILLTELLHYGMSDSHVIAGADVIEENDYCRL